MSLVNVGLSFEWILLILFVVAIVASFIDAIAGGGGMLTIPALLLCGVPPIGALATNKAQAVFGSFTASFTMLKKKMVQWHEIRIPWVTSFVGALLGSLIVQVINPDHLHFLIPIILAGIGLYYLLVPQLGQLPSEPRLSTGIYNTTVLPVIGFYDGFLGPGAGSFFALTNIALRGMHIVQATAAAKVFNFASNAAALLIFLIGGKIFFSIAAVMAVGQMIGAYLGAHILIRKGATLIRPMVVLMCFAMLVKYGYQQLS